MEIKVASYQETNKLLQADLQEVFQSINDTRRVVIRMGGTMNYSDYGIQINSREAVECAKDKFRMKQRFSENNIPTLPSIRISSIQEALTLYQTIEFPCVVKPISRSGGIGTMLINNIDELARNLDIINNQAYIEPLFNTTSEYRIHVSSNNGVFFSVKKIKRNKRDLFITRQNHTNTREFVRPRLWNAIEDACVRALSAIGLDLGAFDVGYNSEGNHSFVIHEVNTAPELLTNTREAYCNELTEMINRRLNQPATNQTTTRRNNRR